MTIDEAIVQAREVASRKFDDRVHCIRCAEEHEQLAEWLEELKAYRAIGTLEECREAVEKQKAKKPIEPDEEYGTFKCPNCGGLIFTEDRFETHKYCLLCGQKLDWSDEDDD